MPKTNKFSLSHYNLMSGKLGLLYPICVREVIPGDVFRHSTSLLVRMAPLVGPVMHPVVIRVHHWFVPNRLLWDDWEDFITGGESGTSTPAFPYIQVTNPADDDLVTHMGIPSGSWTANVNALPVRAYTLIFNECYRDQDLVTASAMSTASGLDATTNTLKFRVAWEKDYFSTIRPNELKGANVEIASPISGIGTTNTTYTAGPQAAYETGRSATESYANYKLVGDSGGAAREVIVEQDPDNTNYPNMRTRIDIEELRLGVSLQRFAERMSRHGSRYAEYLKSLGIRPSDSRLARPEYLGGGKATVQFSEVLYHAEGASDPVGQMAGHGLSAMRTNAYRRFFDEHGVQMTLMSIVPKHMLMEACSRWLLYEMRNTKEEHFQRELQFIGQQVVQNREITPDYGTLSDVFGYQDRYDDMRMAPSVIAGDFRNSNLNHMHMAREIGAQASLNSSWVSCLPTSRIYAAPSDDHVWVMAHNSIQARRMMAAVATPGGRL